MVYVRSVSKLELFPPMNSRLLAIIFDVVDDITVATCNI